LLGGQRRFRDQARLAHQALAKRLARQRDTPLAQVQGGPELLVTHLLYHLVTRVTMPCVHLVLALEAHAEIHPGRVDDGADLDRNEARLAGGDRPEPSLELD
jgi:hypothetical protein